MTFSSNAPKRAPRTVAYLRVSTLDQDTEKKKNRVAILALANHKRLGHVEFVEESVSGTVPWRSRRIAAILEGAGKGDTIIVSELSRLGRSMLVAARHFVLCPGGRGFVQQRLRVLQNGGVEALGEPLVDGGQQLACLFGAAVGSPQPCQTDASV
jgi:hypothetical protein